MKSFVFEPGILDPPSASMKMWQSSLVVDEKYSPYVDIPRFAHTGRSYCRRSYWICPILGDYE